MAYRIPFYQVREELLSVSVAQMARVLGVEPAALKDFEIDGTQLPERPQHLADCLYDAANAAMGGDAAQRQQLGKLGHAIRSLDDIDEDQRDTARLEILAHIETLRDGDREDGRSRNGESISDDLADLQQSEHYSLDGCADYSRLLRQLIRGGPSLRRQVAELLGTGAPAYAAFKLWEGIEAAEKRSPVYVGCTLIQANGWGFQSRGNTWRESLTPFGNNVSYVDLLGRVLRELDDTAAPADTAAIPDLERHVADAYARKAVDQLDDEVVAEARKLVDQMKGDVIGAVGDWTDKPLSSDSPLLLLAVLRAAEWSASEDGLPDLDMFSTLVTGGGLGKVLGKTLKQQGDKLLKTVKNHPVAFGVGLATLLAAGITTWHAQQQLERAGAALTLVHLSELGLLPR